MEGSFVEETTTDNNAMSDDSAQVPAAGSYFVLINSQSTAPIQASAHTRICVLQGTHCSHCGANRALEIAYACVICHDLWVYLVIYILLDRAAIQVPPLLELHGLRITLTMLLLL